MLRPDFLNFEIIIISTCVYTSGVTAVTLTNRPKSVRNRCVIEVLVTFFVLSRWFMDFSVGVGALVIGLSQISAFFSYYTYFAKTIKNMGWN